MGYISKLLTEYRLIRDDKLIARRVYLMGMRGSGKSTVGRRLAAARMVGFVDLDDVTPRILGCEDVGTAWRAHGEGAFRAAEVRALGDAAVLRAGVVALGGGTPTAPGAEAVLLERVRGGARLVYLRAPAEVLRDRLAGSDNAHRPSLTGVGVLAEIESVLAARDPLYQRLATDVIDVGGLTEEEVCERAVRAAGW